mgnify:FL=1
MTTRMAQLKRSIWCLGAAALVLVLCSKTSPLYAFNDWMDANIFFTMGKSMLSGKVLYRDVFDHKGPVLYLLYGLGWLLDHTGFIGVFVLEICGFSVFLGLGLCTAELLRGKPLHPVWCLVPAAAVAACRAFSHGGSAEELLLPFLAAALYGLVKCLTANRQMPLRTVALQGFLCGCALLLKYTVLGFYLAWVAVLAVLNLLLSPARWAGALIGMVCISVPMLLLCLAIPGAFGGGDIKLMAAAGLFLGWQHTLLAMFFGILGGGFYGMYLLAARKADKKDHFAFGPFLCVGIVLALLFGDPVLAWYCRFL